MWHFCFENLTERASMALASDLAAIIGKGDVLALDGDLGLGKSTLARALLRARADDPYLEVPSPTFTLVQTYDFDTLAICHFDLYRISDLEELFEIGLEESWRDGAALIEWPDRAEDLFPSETLWLHFEASDDTNARKLTLKGPDIWAERLQRVCEKRALLIKAGWGDALCEAIPGDLSPRSYARVCRLADDEYDQPDSIANQPQHAILMDSPERAPGPELEDGRLYDEVAHRVTSLAPMIAIANGLETLGLRVPKIYGYDAPAGLMVWEDFGAETLAHDSETPNTERYQATISALAHLHDQTIPSKFTSDVGQHNLPTYDKAAFEVELDVFLDWYWPHVKGHPCSKDERAAFVALWQPLLAMLLDSEQSLTLRDVQSPNCFYLGERGGKPEIGFIDFQDCLLGPVAYDLSALCLDARISIDPALEKAMLATYFQQRALRKADQDNFLLSYHICAVQRISKNLGAFARASASLGRSDYLAHIPRSLTYLERTLAHPVLSDLTDFYKEHGLLETHPVPRAQ